MSLIKDYTDRRTPFWRTWMKALLDREIPVGRGDRTREIEHTAGCLRKSALHDPPGTQSACCCLGVGCLAAELVIPEFLEPGSGWERWTREASWDTTTVGLRDRFAELLDVAGLSYAQRQFLMTYNDAFSQWPVHYIWGFAPPIVKRDLAPEIVPQVQQWMESQGVQFDPQQPLGSLGLPRDQHQMAVSMILDRRFEAACLATEAGPWELAHTTLSPDQLRGIRTMPDYLPAIRVHSRDMNRDTVRLVMLQATTQPLQQRRCILEYSDKEWAPLRAAIDETTYAHTDEHAVVKRLMSNGPWIVLN